MRSERKRGLIFLALIALIAIYLLASVTLPYVKPFFSKLAIVSAGITFPEVGMSLAASEKSLPPVPTPDRPLDIEPITFEKEIPKPIAQQIQPSTPAVGQEISTMKPSNAGAITRKTYQSAVGGAHMALPSGLLRNCTAVTQSVIQKTIDQKPKFSIKANGSPEVLIMHTHATESYQPDLNEWFSMDYSARSTDNTKNMTAVGDKIEQALKDAGIGVIHDRTQHDYPSYNGSYERSAVTVKNILKENPSIKVVLDIHRDAIQPANNSIISPITTINGKDSAQVMIISGCDNGKMNMPNYLENLKLASALQTQMESDYPTLTRPILFDYRKYNQDLTTGSLLIEVGGHGNTLSEALYAGELIGASLVKTLQGLG